MFCLVEAGIFLVVSYKLILLQVIDCRFCVSIFNVTMKEPETQ